jgi:hypothetical protein
MVEAVRTSEKSNSTRLHGAISQKAATFNVNKVRTSLGQYPQPEQSSLQHIRKIRFNTCSYISLGIMFILYYNYKAFYMIHNYWRN